MVDINHYIVISILLFSIGIVGVVARKNIFVIIMSIELMLNSANLLFVAFSRHSGDIAGQVISMMVMGVAAAEAAIGLAIVILVYRYRQSFDIDLFSVLRGDK
jgi:NADH-quinone oxidoreductase subunit K